MIAIKFNFFGNRYHATPWGHHANEGVIEWPPAPWRIFRAIIATGYSHCLWNDEVPKEFKEILLLLSKELPTYYLPHRVHLAHTRHYVPLESHKTKLLLDTWLFVEHPLVIRWENISLSKEQESLLKDLIEKIPYLGRAESRVQATLLQNFECDKDNDSSYYKSVICSEEITQDQNSEVVDLMAPLLPHEYEQWKKAFSSHIPKELHHKIPETIVDCLQVSTEQFQNDGWNRPPGSQKVFYIRQKIPLWREDLSHTVFQGNKEKDDFREIQGHYALLAISSCSVNRNVALLPHVHQTLSFAEKIHRKLVKLSSQNRECPLPLFTGKDNLENPLTGGHIHTHIIPLSLHNREACHLDHVLLWCKEGFTEEYVSVIKSLQLPEHRMTMDDVYKFQFTFLGVGKREELTPLFKNDRFSSLLGHENGSKFWESQTPFVAPRFLKAKGKNSLEEQIKRELESRGFPNIISYSIEKVSDFNRYTIERKRSNVAPCVKFPMAIKLKFEEPILGPLLLGYGSHFGLGQFIATKEY